MQNRYRPRYLDLYNSILDNLQKDLGYKNKMMVPKFDKIVVNIGQGDAVSNIKNLDGAKNNLKLITGQEPIVCNAKNSIAGFKVKKGMPIGCKVTLRKNRLYDFLDRLINIAIPRIRDFRGFSKKNFDGRGNFSIGIKEQIIFPEIDYDKVDKIRGLSITIVTTAKDDFAAKKLLEYFKFPFHKVKV